MFHKVVTSVLCVFFFIINDFELCISIYRWHAHEFKLWYWFAGVYIRESFIANPKLLNLPDALEYTGKHLCKKKNTKKWNPKSNQFQLLKHFCLYVLKSKDSLFRKFCYESFTSSKSTKSLWSLYLYAFDEMIKCTECNSRQSDERKNIFEYASR